MVAHNATMTRLPIDDALPGLISALRDHARAVLQAPPGAGKTTRVPLAMLDAGLTSGKIVMLEPRRLAARAAAQRLAEQLGEEPGQTVGYRIRGESKASKATRIEVVTEGILTRMIQSDSEMTGIGAVLFDEFHERSLNADLGLALCLEAGDHLPSIHSQFDDLQGDLSLHWLALFRHPDSAKPAFADLLQELVAADFRSGFFRWNDWMA